VIMDVTPATRSGNSWIGST